MIGREDIGTGQMSTDAHDGIVLPPTTKEQLPDHRTAKKNPRKSQEGNIPGASTYLEINQKSVGDNHNLDHKFVGDVQKLNIEAHDWRSASEESFAKSGSEYDPRTSTCSDDSDSSFNSQPGVVQYDQSVQIIEESNEFVKSLITSSQTAISPFGGCDVETNIRNNSSELEELTRFTDFGDFVCTEKCVAKPQRPVSSAPARNRTRERRGAKRSLQLQLFSALQRSHQGKKSFFPKKVLSTIITEKCVREELAKYLEDAHSREVIAEYARKICKKTRCEDETNQTNFRCFRKIFVILVLIEKTPAIIKFLEEDVSDLDLPLDLVERSNEKGAYDLRLSRDPMKRLKCFRKKWSQLHIRNFGEWQWTTLSRIFRKGGYKDVEHYELRDEDILPFLDVNREESILKGPGKLPEFHGGFGKVFQVDIHPDHHNFDVLNANKQTFAIKCLHSQDRAQFMKEVEMLKKFSNAAHKHLISLLATYEQSGSFFLIFHWAEADLQRYWKDINPEPSLDKETVLWVAEQCKGIADGIATIHKYHTKSLTLHPERPIFGHHGDIKPENLLWFPDPDQAKTKRGILKLTDFGLAGFSIHHTMSMKPNSLFATSPVYRAPEIDLYGDTRAIGRSYDMWTLGCLYLEFITWLIGGWNLVTEFTYRRLDPDSWLFQQDIRTFFRLVKSGTKDGREVPGAEIKPAVRTFISELHAHEKCTNFLHDFLDMIQNHLLVVEKQDQKTRGRLSSQEVNKKLLDMVQRCQTEECYACHPAPRLGSGEEGSSIGTSERTS